MDQGHDLSPEELQSIEGEIYIALAKSGTAWLTASGVRAHMPRVPVVVIERYLTGLVEQGRAWDRGEPGRRSYRLVG